MLFINRRNGNNSQYICEKVDEGYEVLLFSRSGDLVYGSVFPKEPWIMEINDKICEIGISTGSPSTYVFYFNKVTLQISEISFNSKLLDEKYIVYMENGELIIQDIFDKEIFYKKIVRDFTKTANPSSAIISIELDSSENLILEYYKGKDYIEEIEIIPLYP